MFVLIRIFKQPANTRVIVYWCTSNISVKAAQLNSRIQATLHHSKQNIHVCSEIILEKIHLSVSEKYAILLRNNKPNNHYINSCDNVKH